MLLYIVDRTLIAILPLRLHLLYKAIIVTVNEFNGHLPDIKTLLYMLSCQLLAIICKG